VTAGSGSVSLRNMSRFLRLLVLVVALAVVAWVWPSRWRYDHITVDHETYVVRIDRLTGHADILVPELGWTPAEEPWDSNTGPQDDKNTDTELL